MPHAPKNLVQKILAAHGAAGSLAPGDEVTVTVDQGLLQDATGVPAALQLEAMGIDRIGSRLGVVYIDHNLLQTGGESQTDHRYLESAAARFGLHFSRPGNGICHQVHLERFAAPGEILIGSDSHSPMAGGLGMLAVGVGSLDAAVALGTGRYRLAVPKVIRVTLEGRLGPWVSAKDVVLEVTRRLTVKGGVGAVVEYGGPGAASLSAPERATITNMAVEMGATSAIFPSDERTREFLAAQGRGEQYRALSADPGATYQSEMTIDLAALEPQVALPASPDNVVPVGRVEGTAIGQVIVGSCTNSSYRDLMTVAAVLRGRRIAPGIDLVLAPGSRQVLAMLARNGALGDFVDAGARLIESGCGPCPGMGQVPAPGTVSLRTFNRNFAGRCGSKEVAAKIDVLADHLEELRAEGHRALVFSQFTSFLRRVRARLAREGIASTYLDGSTRNRGEVIEEFKGGDAAVFLISLKAGGVGLTLTEADYVFVLDPWWNPAVEAQAVDRAHRIGQRRPVMVYRLVAADTIEEKVMELKARKAALFAQVVDGDGSMGTPIDAADVRALFGD
jgi:predicted aconitate hydratase